MGEANWELQKYIIGLRHQRTFMVSDMHGQIVDRVISLRRKGAFKKDYLKLVTRPDVTAVIMNDEQDVLSLNCNVDGLILTADLSKDDTLSTAKVQDIFTSIAAAVLPLTDAGDNVSRLGVVREFAVRNIGNAAKTVFSNFVTLDLKGTPDNVLMRFSLKNPSIESLREPEKKGDYKNVLLTISSEREEEETLEEEDDDVKIETVERIPSTLRIVVDYQSYYSPYRNARKMNFEGHFAEAETYIADNKKRFKLDDLTKT